MTGRAASRPSPIIFAVILASASIVSLLIVVSPYILTFHDPGAISVSASVNPTEVGQNQAIKVTVSDVNGLRIPNELPLSGDWRVQNLSMGPCFFYTAYPYGIAVYQGRYTVDNVSSAKSIMIYAPGISNCPTESISNSFTFKPLQNASSSVQLKGYWTEGVTTHPGGVFTQGVLHPFLQGEYTVVAGDEWGHVDILYFQVTSSSATTLAGTVSVPGGGATSTSAISTSTALAATNGTPQLHRVEFLQESNCPYGVWLVPWAVVLDNQTVVQPSNATLPLSYNTSHLTYDSNYSAIWFSLPDGTYSYTILPKNFYGLEQSGNVTVDGSDVVVQVSAFVTAMGCSSTTTAQR